MTALCTTLGYPVRTHIECPASVKRIAALLKNMALFLASPFIGLAYAVLLPFVGLGMLLWVATQGLRQAKAAAPVAEQAEAAEPAAAAPQRAVAVTEEPAETSVKAAAMTVLKLLAAPFAGLAFIVLAPVAALAALAWTAAKGVAHAA